MNKQVKSLLIVLPICLVLAGLTIFLCFLDSTFVIDYLIIAIILSVWAFFIVPSVFYAIDWAKMRLKNAKPEQSFRIGYVWGDVIFLLLIIIAPVTGILWFVKTIKEIVLSGKNKNHIENSEIEEDIFNL